MRQTTATSNIHAKAEVTGHRSPPVIIGLHDCPQSSFVTDIAPNPFILLLSKNEDLSNPKLIFPTPARQPARYCLSSRLNVAHEIRSDQLITDEHLNTHKMTKFIAKPLRKPGNRNVVFVVDALDEW